LKRGWWGLGTLWSAVAIAAWAACAPNAATAQWRPERAVELVISVAPGGNTDITARAIQKIWQDKKLVSPVLVVNKPGGGGAIAAAYLAQRQRDPHHLLMITPGMLTSHIVGSGRAHHSDFKPITILLKESIFISVRSDSSVRSGRDLITRLREAPDSLSVGIASALGNQTHLGLVLPMRAAGVDIKRMKHVIFKSSGESIAALLGGHIDVMASTVAALLPHVRAGRLRIIGMSGAQRMPGVLAEIPTWKEQGAGATFETWRGMLGTKDLTDAQLSFWEQAFAAVSQSPEWKEDVERNFWTDGHLAPAATQQFLDAQYATLEATLTELGLATKGARPANR